MIKSVNLVVVAGLVILVFNLGCNPKSDSRGIVVNPVRSGENKQGEKKFPSIPSKESKCKFTFDDGGSFVRYPDELKETYFGKVFSKHHVKAIAKASGAETIKYLESYGQVKVYRADDSDSEGCLFYSSLDRAPEDFQKHWKEMAGGDGKESTLLGEYLASNSPLVPGHEPTILVKVRNDRWTSMHEFMHHLFESEQAKAGVAQAAAFKSFMENATELNRVVKQINSAKSEDEQLELAKKLIHTLSVHLNYENHFLTNSPLEEVTIETEMLGNFNTFSFVPKNFHMSMAYISANSEKAKTSLQENISMGSKILNLFDSDKTLESILNLSELKQAIAGLEARKAQIAPVVSIAESLYNSNMNQNLMTALMGNALLPPQDLGFSTDDLNTSYGHPDGFWKQVQSIKIEGLTL